MSGIFASISFDGEPLDSASLGRIMRALECRGGDGASTWSGPEAALGCQLRATTLEAAHERQPHANEPADVIVVLDGRLDNRDELQRALRDSGRCLRDDSDVEILLRAYEQWGDMCASRLFGDFAYAIWDAAARTFVCARDVFGVRPLYLYTRGRVVAVASEMSALLRHPGISREPDAGFLAECLNGSIVSRTATVWRDISRLPPGSVLVAGSLGVRVRRYWSPDPSFTLDYRSDAEYAEHLADLVRDAVRRRLRSNARVGVMLSGGIDSSSIIGAIHEIGGAGADRLPTFSLGSPGEPWDETPYQDAVAAMWPIEVCRRQPTEPSHAYYVRAALEYEDLPPYPNGVMADAIFREASAAGVSVVLTGLWSDEWLGGSFLYYSDLARCRHFRRLWQRYKEQSRGESTTGGPSSLWSAGRRIAWPLVPGRARRAIKGVLRRDGVRPWIAGSFARAVDLPDRLVPDSVDVPFTTLAKADTWSAALSGSSLRENELESRGSARFGLDTRHPFADRRIAEFALAIPEEQRWRGAHHKIVLRNAARRWLPPLVANRGASEGAFSVILRTIERHVAAGLWENAASVRHGWVDRNAVVRAYGDMMAWHREGDNRFEPLVFPLWFACAAEIFARHVLDKTDR